MVRNVLMLKKSPLHRLFLIAVTVVARTSRATLLYNTAIGTVSNMLCSWCKAFPPFHARVLLPALTTVLLFAAYHAQVWRMAIMNATILLRSHLLPFLRRLSRAGFAGGFHACFGYVMFAMPPYFGTTPTRRRRRQRWLLPLRHHGSLPRVL